MRKQIAAAVLTAFAASSLWAQISDKPPAYVAPTEKVQREAPPAPAQPGRDVMTPEKRKIYESSRLEPTAEDMARAREAKKQHHDSGRTTSYRSEYGTVIEEHHDQNNRLTEVRVTPGSTEIPYTMKNTSERPIDNTPGTDSRSTLDTPKFIQFSW